MVLSREGAKLIEGCLDDLACRSGCRLGVFGDGLDAIESADVVLDRVCGVVKGRNGGEAVRGTVAG